MRARVSLAVGVLIAVLVLTGCGKASPTSSSPAAPSTSTAQPAATAAGSGAATCPTLAQANGALGVSDSGPIRTSAGGNGIVCAYTGAGGSAAVAIFAHDTAAVFAGQVANADRVPGMQPIPGVGDGAFGLTAGGRSVVNAWADGSRTFAAAQAPGALAPVEALARIALADNS